MICKERHILASSWVRIRSWMAGPRRRIQPLLFSALLAANAFFLGGCRALYEDEIQFSSDGSGQARLTIGVSKEFEYMSTSSDDQLKQAREMFQKKHGSALKISRRSDNEWIYWDLSFEFKSPQDLERKINTIFNNDPPLFSIAFTTYREGGKLKFRYNAQLRAPSSEGLDLKFTHTVVLPGPVEQSDGTVRGNRVSWQLKAGESRRVTAIGTVGGFSLGGIALIILLIILGIVGGGGGVLLLSGMRRRRGQARWCEQCGAPLPAGARYCEQCGAPVR